jgi:hypothetical protein
VQTLNYKIGKASSISMKKRRVNLDIDSIVPLTTKDGGSGKNKS